MTNSELENAQKEPPRCLSCGKETPLKAETSVYRRGWRTVEVETHFWECPTGCSDPMGEAPFRFRNATLLRANDQAAREAWWAKYKEEMPDSGFVRAQKKQTIEEAARDVRRVLAKILVDRYDKAACIDSCVKKQDTVWTIVHTAYWTLNEALNDGHRFTEEELAP